MSKMKTIFKDYSVLMSYPMGTTDNHMETYFAWETATTPERAVALARHQVPAVQHHEVAAEDMAVLLVIEGHHETIFNVNDDI